MTVALDPVTVHRPWPFVACPTCGHEDFVVAGGAQPVVFTCVHCHASWRYLLGYLQQVTPALSYLEPRRTSENQLPFR